MDQIEWTEQCGFDFFVLNKLSMTFTYDKRADVSNLIGANFGLVWSRKIILESFMDGICGHHIKRNPFWFFYWHSLISLNQHINNICIDHYVWYIAEQHWKPSTIRKVLWMLNVDCWNVEVFRIDFLIISSDFQIIFSLIFADYWTKTKFLVMVFIHSFIIRSFD